MQAEEEETKSGEWSRLCARCSAPLEPTATACPECGMAVLSLKSPKNQPEPREKLDFSRLAPTIASYMITDFRDGWTVTRARPRFTITFVVIVLVLEASIAYLLFGGVLPWDWDLGRRILASGILINTLLITMFYFWVRVE